MHQLGVELPTIAAGGQAAEASWLSSAIAGLIGVLVGALLAFVTSIYLANRAERAEARSIIYYDLIHDVFDELWELAGQARIGRSLSRNRISNAITITRRIEMRSRALRKRRYQRLARQVHGNLADLQQTYQGGPLTGSQRKAILMSARSLDRLNAELGRELARYFP
ncbi:hypothetical protein [Naasia sp. SYSU D00057]|uniref:hypothetical protein n=1 Tax=Naasia sp. SYSU D00057 TaxID=2817380 RepID=UPI001B31648C|nr:hypothetical protein [Naasia sp. SYSU D00057]